MQKKVMFTALIFGLCNFLMLQSMIELSKPIAQREVLFYFDSPQSTTATISPVKSVSTVDEFEQKLSKYDGQLVNYWWYTHQGKLKEYQRRSKLQGQRLTEQEIVIEILEREKKVAQIKENVRKKYTSYEEFALNWKNLVGKALHKADKNVTPQHLRDVLRRENATFRSLESLWNLNLE